MGPGYVCLVSLQDGHIMKGCWKATLDFLIGSGSCDVKITKDSLESFVPDPVIHDKMRSNTARESCLIFEVHGLLHNHPTPDSKHIPVSTHYQLLNNLRTRPSHLLSSEPYEHDVLCILG